MHPRDPAVLHRRRTRPANSARTRALLLEAAVKCFAARGFRDTGIRWIGAEAGVNPALVCYHFGNKAGLYRETLQIAMEKRVARLADLLPKLPTDPGTPRPDLIQGLQEYLLACADQILDDDLSDPLEAAALRLVAREIEAPAPESEQVLLQCVEPFELYLHRCVSALCPGLGEEARFAVILSLQGPLFYLRSNRGLIRLLRSGKGTLDRRSIVQNYVSFILNGVQQVSGRKPQGGKPGGNRAVRVADPGSPGREPPVRPHP